MKNKVFIVTGATKGMGYAISERLLKLGSKVAMVYRSDEKRAEECRKSLKDYEENLLLIKADISELNQHQLILDKSLEKFSRVDVLVNNAGVAPKAGFLKMDEDEYDRVVGINLKGPIFLAQKIAKQMIKQKIKGSIINFASTSAYQPEQVVSYGPAKMGIITATKAMAAVLGPYGIRVNSISPGTHKTEMNRYHWENDTDIFRQSTVAIPLGRAAEASEITGAVVFLSSNESSYITGIDIVADGGFSSHRGKIKKIIKSKLDGVPALLVIWENSSLRSE